LTLFSEVGGVGGPKKVDQLFFDPDNQYNDGLKKKKDKSVRYKIKKITLILGGKGGGERGPKKFINVF